MILPLQLQTVHVTIDPTKIEGRLSKTAYGFCIEDVNHEVYGGLYDQRIFGESFEEPPPDSCPLGWRAYGGSWTPDGTAVHVGPGDGPKLVREMAPLGDGLVETEVALSDDSSESAGLLVRVSGEGIGADAFIGYEIGLSSKNQAVFLGRHEHDFHLLKSVGIPIARAKWHRLGVRLAGSRIQVFLDSVLRLEYVDSSPLPAGRVALRAWRADASFRNVQIEDRARPISLAGPGVSGMWDGFATRNALPKFGLEGHAYNGALCQHIQLLGGKGEVGVANRGLNRWGIGVRAGRRMEGCLYLRGDVPGATVRLQSSDGKLTYAQQVVPVGSSWKRASFRLTPTKTDPSARFTVSLDRPGSLWVDQASLFDSPADRFGGLRVRRDIALGLIQSGVKFLRYGGTMVNALGYRWKNMIGEPNLRPPYAGHWYPCSTNGFGIFEFLQFCEQAHFGSAFAINAEETDQDAADLADYLTAPVTNPWGRRRAGDGHPKPYSPDYIEIGNEEAIGATNAESLSHYIERFRRISKAIHGRNPHLKLVCAAWWVSDEKLMKSVFDAVDGEAAAWDLHFWCDDVQAGTAVGTELDRAHRLFQSWNPKSKMKAVIFEENGERHDAQRALGHATTLIASMQRSDFVPVDCAANALQPLKQNDNGWDQGNVFFTPDRAWLMPPALAHRLMTSGDETIRVYGENDANLDLVALRNPSGSRLAVRIANTLDHAVKVSLSLVGATPKSCRARALSGDMGAAIPASIRSVGRDVDLTLPGRSVTAVELDMLAKN